MIVHQIPVGPMQNFSYIVVDEDTSESIICLLYTSDAADE